MKRRDFLKTAAAGALLSNSILGAGSKKLKKPNIIFIITDQQFADGMSCVLGDEYIHTPNMDSLAETGVRFTRAYSPNPICVPMRTSTFTGMFPHQTGVQVNTKDAEHMEDYLHLGKAFKNAGYQTAYFGKWHIPVDGDNTAIHGFEIWDGNGRLSGEPVADFIKQKHARPFFAVASFLSPHEICEWARKQEIPGDPLPDVPALNERPLMRKNSAPPEDETDGMTLMRKSYHNTRTFPVGDYTEDDWRRHIWGYYRLIERADGFIGEIIRALRESGQEENTVIMFVSDHGDCHGAHGFNQKTVFYDESVRVPCIISWKGTTNKKTSDVLINIGTDVFPTLCDFASIKVPDSLPGKSLRKHALDETPNWKRDYIVSQNHMKQGGTVDGVKPTMQGRMVRSDRFKYCIYSQGAHRESLIDMENDPGEMKNLARDNSYAEVLEQHRAMLREHGVMYEDQLALDMLDPDYVTKPA